jgi:hypothetical protein
MDKNIAALLREDVKTVRVRFYSGNTLEDLLVDMPNKENFQDRRAFEDACAKVRAMNKIKLYTYVTDLPVAPGDLVMVYARSLPCIVLVEVVDKTCAIEPNDPTRYQWVVQKIDLTYFNNLNTANAEIEAVVADAYKTNLRKSFAQQILSGLESSDATRLSGLLKGPVVR